jgi:hypothetical protein
MLFSLLHAVHKQIDSFNKKPRFEANKQEKPILFKKFTFVTGTFIVTCQDDVVKEIDFAVMLI